MNNMSEPQALWQHHRTPAPKHPLSGARLQSPKTPRTEETDLRPHKYEQHYTRWESNALRPSYGQRYRTRCNNNSSGRRFTNAPPPAQVENLGRGKQTPAPIPMCTWGAIRCILLYIGSKRARLYARRPVSAVSDGRFIRRQHACTPTGSRNQKGG